MAETRASPEPADVAETRTLLERASIAETRTLLECAKAWMPNTEGSGEELVMIQVDIQKQVNSLALDGDSSRKYLREVVEHLLSQPGIWLIQEGIARFQLTRITLAKPKRRVRAIGYLLQARKCMKEAKAVLERLGADLCDVPSWLKSIEELLVECEYRERRARDETVAKREGTTIGAAIGNRHYNTEMVPQSPGEENVEP